MKGSTFGLALVGITLATLAAAVGQDGKPAAPAGASATPAASAAPGYVDPTYGFTIRPPSLGKPAAGAAMVVQMYAPPASGFATNVNVTVQMTRTTRAEYRKLSVAQFKQAGVTVSSDTDVTVAGRDAIALDYEAALPQGKLRWLSLAVILDDRVELVTASTTQAQFAAVEKELRACLDSYRPGQ